MSQAGKFEYFFEKEALMLHDFRLHTGRVPNQSEKDAIFVNLLRYFLGKAPLKCKQAATSGVRSKYGKKVSGESVATVPAI